MEPEMELDRFDLEERRRRRVSVVAGIVALLVLIVCGVVLYPRLTSVLAPEAQLKEGPPQETNDVTVTRGPLTQALLLGGGLEPERSAKLAYKVASGPVAMVYVAPGMPVEAGQLMVELDETALQRDLAKARGDLLEARIALDELLEDRGLTKRIQLEEELRKARLSLEQQRRDLALFNEGKGTPQEKMGKATAEVTAAQEALTDLREGKERQQALESQRITADLAEIEHGPYAWIQNPSEEDRDREWLLRIPMLNTRDSYNQALLQYDMDVRAAEQKLVLAQRTMSQITAEIAAGSPALELAKRQVAVQQAEANVQRLQDQLLALDEDIPDPDVAKAQALVVKAEGRTADAEASLQEAKLVAPFAGVVNEVRVVPGARVSPGAVVVTLYSAVQLRVVAHANEMDVGQLTQGKEVRLSFDAFPGQAITGTLEEIPRYGTYQNGITYFRVAVAFEPGDLVLRAGMSVNVSVPLMRKESVLLIPTMAVQRDGEGSFVLVVEGNKTKQRRIVTGISDGIQTEVVQGLEEGETVRSVLQYPIGPIYR